MVQDQAIDLAINPISWQVAGPSSKLEDLERVVLADVRKAWTDYQSTRERSAVYPYLHMVFMQVDWWARNPLEKDEALRAIKRQSLKLALPEDPFAAVIACTADPKKEKVRSKWTRVLRYAAKYKPDKELLRDFLQRKGGINSCAARYARRLGRKAKAKTASRISHQPMSEANSPAR
jgi:hypothetical protein